MVLALLAGLAIGAQDEAKALLDQTLALYQRTQSYEDSGIVSSVMQTAGETSEAPVRTIRTVFVRPDHVRFECHEIDAVTKVDEYYVVWKGKTKSHTWWSRLANGTHHDLPLQSLREASATSGGASDLLYPLFVPGAAKAAKAWSLADLAEAKLAGSEDVDESPCRVLTGKGYEGSEITVWIDAKTYAIRQFREVVAHEQFTSIDTITLKPQLEKALTVEDAWFGPPIVTPPPGGTGGGGHR